jgi:hypothetical protein
MEDYVDDADLQEAIDEVMRRFNESAMDYFGGLPCTPQAAHAIQQFATAIVHQYYQEGGLDLRSHFHIGIDIQRSQVEVKMDPISVAAHKLLNTDLWQKWRLAL